MVKQSTFLEQDPSAKRHFERYLTPRWMTEAMLRRVTLPSCASVLEPCVGDSDVANVLRELGRNPFGARQPVTVFTNDIDQRCQADFHCDATGPALWDALRRQKIPVDVVITNPPWSLAFDIIQRSLAVANLGVVMLLNRTWDEPTKKRDTFLAQFPPTNQIVNPRYAFRRKGSPSTTSAWFIWRIHPAFAPNLRPLDYVTRAERNELIAKYGKAA